MKCPNCGSQNVTLQSSKAKPKPPKGIVYWLLIGWWTRALLWVLTQILQLFGHDQIEAADTARSRKIFICQNCGFSWLPPFGNNKELNPL